MEPLPVLLLLLASTAAGVVNVVAGGGSLLTVPTLIFLGAPPSLAIATNRATIGVLSLTGLLRYRQDGLVRWRLARRPALLASLAAVLGALALFHVPEATLRRVVGGTMIALVLLVLWAPERRYATRAGGPLPPGWVRRFADLLLPLGFGFYGGFYGAGVSSLFLVSFVLLDRLSYVEAAATTQVVVGGLSLAATLVLLARGAVLARFALPLLLGFALGGWLGAHLAARGGERVVRVTLVVVSLGLAAKLLIEP